MKNDIGMDIGTAKINKEEMQGIQHYLIDVLEPWEDFNVVTFQKMCKNALEGIYDRGHIPIVTGGTGFYIQALLRDIDFTENEENTEYRRFLETLSEKKGLLYFMICWQRWIRFLLRQYTKIIRNG